jgi:hypothetical protein
MMDRRNVTRGAADHIPTRARLVVGVVVERRRLSNPWADAAWLPAAILPGMPAAAAWTVLDHDDDRTRYYAGAHELLFASIETANYIDNLSTGAPKIWVALREGDGPFGIEVCGVTADPAEGESFTESGGNIVEALPMPPDIAARLAQFVDEHHVERRFFKRKRDDGGKAEERGDD